MATPIILKITEAGKNAILDSENSGITLRLKNLAIGSGKYTPTGNETALQSEISRHSIVSGNVEPQSHTLRFSASITANSEVSVFEIGLMTETNVLFAVASSTDNPLLKIYPDITSIGSFGLTLDEFDTSNITVVNDPNGALSIVLMQQHLASPDPHPQYALRKYVQDQIDILLNRPFEGIPVWGILATVKHYKNGDEVAQDLRYGKWQRYAQGKVLAGYSTLSSDIPEYKTMGNEFGANAHTLTIDEMPSHNHGINLATQISGSGNPATASRSSLTGSLVTANTGGNKPHSNLQPAIVVAFWVRMPNDYTAPQFDLYWTEGDNDNRITSAGENQDLYLWLTAKNLVQSMPISVNIGSNDALSFSANADFSHPNSIGNGRHKIAHLPADSYVVTEDITLNVGVTLSDSHSLSAPLLINDTVDNTPILRGDSVFLIGLDSSGNIIKSTRTQGNYNLTVKNSSISGDTTNPYSRYIEAITIELDKAIAPETLFINAGLYFPAENAFVWKLMYSGDPALDNYGDDALASNTSVTLDSTGKLITISANDGNASMVLTNDRPMQLIIGNDISRVSNEWSPTYRYDNTNTPIPRPFSFVGRDGWTNFASTL